MSALTAIDRALPHTAGCVAHRGAQVSACICWHDGVLARLLPVVQALVAEGKAEVLEAAANDPELAHIVSLETDVGVMPHRVVAVADLYARAAALRASNGEGT